MTQPVTPQRQAWWRKPTTIITTLAATSTTLAVALTIMLVLPFVPKGGNRTPQAYNECNYYNQKLIGFNYVDISKDKKAITWRMRGDHESLETQSCILLELNIPPEIPNKLGDTMSAEIDKGIDAIDKTTNTGQIHGTRYKQYNVFWYQHGWDQTITIEYKP